MASITIPLPDFSKAGLGKGFKNGLKVLGYHIVTDAGLIAIALISSYIKSIDISTVGAEKAGYVALAIAGGNFVVKFLKDWLSTSKSYDPYLTPGISTDTLPNAPIDEPSAFAI